MQRIKSIKKSAIQLSRQRADGELELVSAVDAAYRVVVNEAGMTV
jgi:hypothetical protein